jgi:hypothetical protein
LKVSRNSRASHPRASEVLECDQSGCDASALVLVGVGSWVGNRYGGVVDGVSGLDICNQLREVNGLCLEWKTET